MRDEFLVLTTTGKVTARKATAKEAIAEAAREAKASGGGVYATIDQLDPASDKEQNPPPTVMRAYELSRLGDALKKRGEGSMLPDGSGGSYRGLTKEDVMSLSLEQAWRRLRDYFPAGRLQVRSVAVKDASGDRIPTGKLGKTGKPTFVSEKREVEHGGKVWDSPESSAENFFKENTKMEKNATELFTAAGILDAQGKPLDASSYGLSLLPHYIAFRGGLVTSPKGSHLSIFAKSPEEIKKHYSPKKISGEGTWCAGSSGGCRATCLSFSGQNQVADEAILYKHAMSHALLADPLAFCRLMVEGLRKQMNYKGKAERWARLNVYQDIPWEVLFPDMFLRAGDDNTSKKVGGWLPTLRTYDYTKTLNRDFTEGYNLTFSYNGHNEAACRAALASGRNIAVVVILTGQGAEQPLRFRHAADVDPRSPLARFFYPIDLSGIFGVYPVLNGDLHDIRPYDHLVLDKAGWKGAAIVGLDYKIPMVKTGAGEAEKLAEVDSAGRFVLRVKVINEEVVLPAGGVAAYMLTKLDV